MSQIQPAADKIPPQLSDDDDDPELKAMVQKGMDEHDVNAIRPPPYAIAGWAEDWGLSERRVLWRIYLPHLPYTTMLTMHQAAKCFPYKHHLMERKLSDIYEKKCAAAKKLAELDENDPLGLDNIGVEMEALIARNVELNLGDERRV